MSIPASIRELANHDPQISQYSPRYTKIRDWHEIEAADLLYLDNTGLLIQILREYCIGGFSYQITYENDYTAYPTEYYLGGKSPSAQRNTRFYISRSQYKKVSV